MKKHNIDNLHGKEALIIPRHMLPFHHKDKPDLKNIIVIIEIIPEVDKKERKIVLVDKNLQAWKPFVGGSLEICNEEIIYTPNNFFDGDADPDLKNPIEIWVKLEDHPEEFYRELAILLQDCYEEEFKKLDSLNMLKIDERELRLMMLMPPIDLG